MSKADELFDEMGYEKIHDNGRRIVYKKPLTKIVFKKWHRWVDVCMNLDMQELQAINEKVKELGWLDE